jgi:hypothetical protein
VDTRARFSSRKFWLVEQTLLLSFVLSLLGKLTAEFSGVVGLVVGAYVGINGYVEGRRINAGNGDEE